MPWLHSFQSVVELGFFPTMDRLTAASPETIFQRTLICWSTLALDWVEWVELVECGEQVDKAKHSACFVAKLDIAGSAQRQKGGDKFNSPSGCKSCVQTKDTFHQRLGLPDPRQRKLCRYDCCLRCCCPFDGWHQELASWASCALSAKDGD